MLLWAVVTATIIITTTSLLGLDSNNSNSSNHLNNNNHNKMHIIVSEIVAIFQEGEYIKGKLKPHLPEIQSKTIDNSITNSSSK